MSAKPATTEKNGVILIRMGVGREEIVLPEGATLADLLREAKVEDGDHEILIDGRPLEDALVLQPGMIVTLAAGNRNVRLKRSWKNSVGMFQNDPTFPEFIERVQARRDQEREDA